MRHLVAEHARRTDSPLAAGLLEHWEERLGEFRKVMPRDYRQALKARFEEETAELRATTSASGGPMTNPRGFLQIERVEQPEREPHRRIADHRDLHERLTKTELSRQGERCMGCGVPFCLNGCPLGNLIPDWNGLVADGEWRQAIDQLHATNPFPELTGLICPAPCESACVLEINSDPVTIKQVELGIVERAWLKGWIQPHPPAMRSGQRVAVVGSGPAGMAVAADLNQAGHTVIVYERDEAPGGLNRFGVPDAKLPKEVIDRRIGLMEAEGIEFRCGVDVGGAVDPAELLRGGRRSRAGDRRAGAAPRSTSPAPTWPACCPR